jgi:hypothetical protein
MRKENMEVDYEELTGEASPSSPRSDVSTYDLMKGITPTEASQGQKEAYREKVDRFVEKCQSNVVGIQEDDQAAIVDTKRGTQNFGAFATGLTFQVLMEQPWRQQPTRLLPGIDKIEKILTRRNFDQAVGRVATWLIKLRPWDVSGRPEEDWKRDWRKHLGAVKQYNASNPNRDPIVWSVVPVNPLHNESVVEYVAI